MSCLSCTAILAIAVGISTVPAAHAAQIANGLSLNGLSANGADVRGRLNDASSSTARLKAMILQDGSVISLK
ncbi:hypothetical protein AA309_13535 [Microvirga vignae]|uniref:Uncharacterized protein n=1 Tax=Microvirga vignae TaxID=1225564 RepID=A0A0H1RCV4_9HYPH|nr:hypothetical protein [Microvirga vignae]KLK92691.1 hypothetical protein AA309_13535 [Microvirga vignae]